MITRVIGVGNEDRCDDAAGLLAARELRGSVPAGVEVIECDGELGRLLELLEGADRVLLVDAAVGAGPAGAVRRLRAPESWHRSSSSSYALGVGEAIALAAAMGRLPGEVVVCAISGGRFDLGPASLAVEAGAREAATRILRELGRAQQGRRS